MRKRLPILLLASLLSSCTHTPDTKDSLRYRSLGLETLFVLNGVPIAIIRDTAGILPLDSLTKIDLNTIEAFSTPFDPRRRASFEAKILRFPLTPAAQGKEQCNIDLRPLIPGKETTASATFIAAPNTTSAMDDLETLQPLTDADRAEILSQIHALAAALTVHDAPKAAALCANRIPLQDQPHQIAALDAAFKSFPTATVQPDSRLTLRPFARGIAVYIPTYPPTPATTPSTNPTTTSQPATSPARLTPTPATPILQLTSPTDLSTTWRWDLLTFAKRNGQWILVR